MAFSWSAKLNGANGISVSGSGASSNFYFSVKLSKVKSDWDGYKGSTQAKDLEEAVDFWDGVNFQSTDTASTSFSLNFNNLPYNTTYYVYIRGVSADLKTYNYWGGKTTVTTGSPPTYQVTVYTDAYTTVKISNAATGNQTIGTSSNGTYTYTQGSPATMQASSTNGYKFDGWYWTKIGSSYSNLESDEPIFSYNSSGATFYAHSIKEVKSYTLTIYYDGPGKYSLGEVRSTSILWEAEKIGFAGDVNTYKQKKTFTIHEGTTYSLGINFPQDNNGEFNNNYFIAPTTNKPGYEYDVYTDASNARYAYTSNKKYPGLKSSVTVPIKNFSDDLTITIGSHRYENYYIGANCDANVESLKLSQTITGNYARTLTAANSKPTIYCREGINLKVESTPKSDYRISGWKTSSSGSFIVTGASGTINKTYLSSGRIFFVCSEIDASIHTLTIGLINSSVTVSINGEKKNVTESGQTFSVVEGQKVIITSTKKADEPDKTYDDRGIFLDTSYSNQLGSLSNHIYTYSFTMGDSDITVYCASYVNYLFNLVKDTDSESYITDLYYVIEGESEKRRLINGTYLRAGTSLKAYAQTSSGYKISKWIRNGKEDTWTILNSSFYTINSIDGVFVLTCYAELGAPNAFSWSYNACNINNSNETISIAGKDGKIYKWNANTGNGRDDAHTSIYADYYGFYVNVDEWLRLRETIRLWGKYKGKGDNWPTFYVTNDSEFISNTTPFYAQEYNYIASAINTLRGNENLLKKDFQQGEQIKAEYLNNLMIEINKLT